MSSVIRVFVLDDHEVVRMGFRALLELEARDIQVVAEAATVKAALAICPPLCPDVAILDIRLQDGSGIDVCREISRKCPKTSCVIFTSADPSDDLLYEAILAGAKGWILKHASMTEMIEAIRICARGGSALSSRAQMVMMERVRHPDRQSSPLGVLTEQEQRILKLIGQGNSNREIGRTLGLAEKTVKNYISRIFTKLGVQSRTQAVALAHAISFAHRAAENIEDALIAILSRGRGNQAQDRKVKVAACIM